MVNAILGISQVVREGEECVCFLHTSGPTDELSEGGKKNLGEGVLRSRDAVCMLLHLTSSNSDDACSSSRM